MPFHLPSTRHRSSAALVPAAVCSPTCLTMSLRSTSRSSYSRGPPWANQPKMSWPLLDCASDSRARGQLRQRDVVDGDFDVVLFAPLLRPSGSKNSVSYSGTKWLHCRILSSPPRFLLAVRGAAVVGSRLCRGGGGWSSRGGGSRLRQPRRGRGRSGGFGRRGGGLRGATASHRPPGSEAPAPAASAPPMPFRKPRRLISRDTCVRLRIVCEHHQIPFPFRAYLSAPPVIPATKWSRKKLYRMATGTPTSSAAAISDPQKYTSPRTRSVVMPSVTGFSAEVETNVSA